MSSSNERRGRSSLLSLRAGMTMTITCLQAEAAAATAAERATAAEVARAEASSESSALRDELVAAREEASGAARASAAAAVRTQLNSTGLKVPTRSCYGSQLASALRCSMTAACVNGHPLQLYASHGSSWRSYWV